MIFRAFGQSDRGRCRENNEDSFSLACDLGLFVVADGIGGLAAGEVASRMTVDAVADYLRQPAAVEEPFIGSADDAFSEAARRLAAAVRYANGRIRQAAADNPPWRGMGTTLAAAWVRGDRVCIAHVGDSRVYLLRGPSIIPLTEDHSLRAEQLRQGLESTAPGNIITRALGIAPELEVALSEVSLSPGDRLLLCTDGLTGVVPDPLLLSLVRGAAGPRSACRTLVDLANCSGGPDNISIIAVYFDSPGLTTRMKNLLFYNRR
ncbi:serine/threonine protein phosphatase PrpC [Desulfuromonas soudanensis]|uniref:Serine/threonine protein phosphatase PrpC n=1 Tax=Desulfuromonas soudanensis TaxID=1603606 RepID=A0A0M3QGB2_9BACT|nr:protein phosphatase 2C domain-containing protein [Desulfuromonas soudanensis]ALC17513.1 serine/threonine protein phosphatase PrpC [Desulfuromonas soudanensis]